MHGYALQQPHGVCPGLGQAGLYVGGPMWHLPGGSSSAQRGRGILGGWGRDRNSIHPIWGVSCSASRQDRVERLEQTRRVRQHL